MTTMATTAPALQSSLAELIDELSRFDGPPERFLLNMLAGQCLIARAGAGAMLRLDGEGRADVVALHPALPTNQPTPAWLNFALEMTGRVCRQAMTLITPLRAADQLYEEEARKYLVMVPLLGDGGVRGAEAFVIESGDVSLVNEASQRIELSVSLLNLYEMRLTTQRSKRDVGRLGQVIEIVAAMNPHERLQPSAMALCNEIAARFEAERVSLGFMHHRTVRLAAMSHTNRFSRKMKLVQMIESVMEESLDQDVEVLHPAAAESTTVCRAAAELATRQTPMTVLTLPLRHKGEPVAAVTIERPANRPFAIDEIETLRLLCDVATARLFDLHRHDRWFGAKLLDGARQGLALAVGSKHTWAKVAAIVVLAAMAFVTLAGGTYRVESNFVMEAAQRRIIPAPFDSFLAAVNVSPGDRVQAGSTVLAALDVHQLELQLNEAEARQNAWRTKSDQARRQGDAVESQVAMMEAEKQHATAELLRDQIARAQILSPIDGVVLTGDLDKRLGGPVKTGESLFEVAPLDQLWANLWVPEDRIAEIQVGQVGRLASSSHPGEYIPFIVEQIHPVAELVGQRNVFRVRARLLETQPWMRPGMEGLAKVEVGRRSYAWIWSRGLVNWLRMKLWL